MVKTIHDIAVSYGKEHQGTVDIEVFEEGANAVLEKVLTYMESKPAHKGERFYNGLKDYIEQLKGEFK